MNEDYEIIKPIGLKQPVRMIEQVAENSIRYAASGRIPAPCLIALDEGNGRNTLCTYMLEMYEKNDVMDWTGIDHLLRLDFRDSMAPFEDYNEAAIFARRFAGIVVHILTDEFSSYLFDNNLHNSYIRKTVDTARYAALVIFTPRSPGKVLTRLLSHLKKAFDDEFKKENRLKTPDPGTYSMSELTEITKRSILRMGAMIGASAFGSYSSELIKERQITTAAAAAELGRELIFHADYTDGTVPTVTDRELEQFIKKVIKVPAPVTQAPDDGTVIEMIRRAN